MRILRGSTQDAAYIRKHGHGDDWKIRYKVLEVRPHAVRLEIPTDGSAPRINEWQSITRCEPATESDTPPVQQTRDDEDSKSRSTLGARVEAWAMDRVWTRGKPIFSGRHPSSGSRRHLRRRGSGRGGETQTADAEASSEEVSMEVTEEGGNAQ